MRVENVYCCICASRQSSLFVLCGLLDQMVLVSPDRTRCDTVKREDRQWMVTMRTEPLWHHLRYIHPLSYLHIRQMFLRRQRKTVRGVARGPRDVRESVRVCALPSSWWCGQWFRCGWWVCPGSGPPPWGPSSRPSRESWQSPSFPSHRCSWTPPRQISGCPRRAPSPQTPWCPHTGFQSRDRLWWPRRSGGPWGKSVSVAFPGSCSWGRSRCRCLCPGTGFRWHPVNTEEFKPEKRKRNPQEDTSLQIQSNVGHSNPPFPISHMRRLGIYKLEVIKVRLEWSSHLWNQSWIPNDWTLFALGRSAAHRCSSWSAQHLCTPHHPNAEQTAWWIPATVRQQTEPGWLWQTLTTTENFLLRFGSHDKVDKQGTLMLSTRDPGGDSCRAMVSDVSIVK